MKRNQEAPHDGSAERPAGPVSSMSRSESRDRALKDAHDRVLFDALLRSYVLFRDHATPEEQQEEQELLERARNADSSIRHLLYEDLLVLERTVDSRRRLKEAERQGNSDEACRIRLDSERWITTMRATRAALNAMGWTSVRFSTDTDKDFVFISIEEGSVQDWRERKREFSRVLKKLLTPLPVPKVWFSSWSRLPETEAPESTRARFDVSFSSDPE